jgi:hypothetical protein
MKIPTEKFEEKLLAMDLTAEQFVDYIGYESEVFLGNVANASKDIIRSHKMKNDIPYGVEFKVKELKKIIDEEPESLEYISNTLSIESYKRQLKLVKVKFNFYLRFLKYYKNPNNIELENKCKEMYDMVLKTILDMEPINPTGNTAFLYDNLKDISIFIPIHRVDFLK